MNRAVLLRDYLREVRSREFQPGKWDCALFWAGWVERCTGVDPARGWRSKYRTIKQGRKMLAEAGYPTVEDLALAYAEELPGWSSAMVGDLATVTHRGATCCGIVGGNHIQFLQIGGGLRPMRLPEGERFFRP